MTRKASFATHDAQDGIIGTNQQYQNGDTGFMIDSHMQMRATILVESQT
jgi:hypothetical protein